MYLVSSDVPLVELMYLVFTHMPCESYCCCTYLFWALINWLVCWLCNMYVNSVVSFSLARLLLPMVTWEVVSWLQPNDTASSSLSMYGFLYGTFPTAPSVVLYATQYSVAQDTVSTCRPLPKLQWKCIVSSSLSLCFTVHRTVQHGSGHLWVPVVKVVITVSSSLCVLLFVVLFDTRCSMVQDTVSTC